MPVKAKPAEDRFYAKVVAGPNGCHIWTGAKNWGGYGVFGYDGRKTMTAHRWAIQFLRGPVAAGMVIDHLCRVRNCVNPDHLEVVTQRENLMRGETRTAERAAQTHCLRGHTFDEANTRRKKSDGTRECRACGRIRAARR